MIKARSFRLAASLGGPAIAALVVWLGFAREARAFECTAVPDASPPVTQAWNQRCIPYYIDRRGSLLSGDERKALIAQSFRVWSGLACTDLEFTFAGYTSDGSGFDPRRADAQKNVIVSVEDAQEASLFPDRNLLAITLTSFSTETGEIFDADILLNGVRFSFVEVDDDATCRLQGRDTYDLRNTLVHEMGHLVGFDHETKTDSTMFASAEPCETKKRDLTPDDEAGICRVYATGQPTRTCDLPSIGYDDAAGDPSRFREQCVRLTETKGCTCVASGRDGLATPLLGGLGVLLFLGVRRRSRAA